MRLVYEVGKDDPWPNEGETPSKVQMITVIVDFEGSRSQSQWQWQKVITYNWPTTEEAFEAQDPEFRADSLKRLDDFEKGLLEDPNISEEDKTFFRSLPQEERRRRIRKIVSFR